MIKEISKLTKIREEVLVRYELREVMKNPAQLVGECTKVQFEKLEMLIELAKGLARAEGEKRQRLDSSMKARDFFISRLRGEGYEHLDVAYLNGQNVLIKCIREFSGTVNESSVMPRNIVKNALLLNASCVVLAHNHPSGSLSPSRADRDVTKKIKEGLKSVDINIVDHIIVTDDDYYSFAENGEV